MIVNISIMKYVLPNNHEVEIAFLHKYPNGGSLYFQSIRSGRITDNSAIATIYKAKKQLYAIGLCELVTNLGITFDALIAPPSSRSDSEPYVDAILEKSAIPDWSNRFSRKKEIKAAEAKSVEEMFGEFEYEPKGGEKDVKNLLFVDESLATGKSIAALLMHLKNAGLPEDCNVVVAVPALLQE